MDTTPIEGAKRNSMPKWIQIGLLAAGIILIAVGLFKIFGGSGASNVFVDKFNEMQAPGVEVKNDLTSVGNLLSGIGAKEAQKDYAGINSDLQTALAKLNDAAAKTVSMSVILTEFQSIVDGSSDQNVKTAGARLTEVSKSRNAAVLKMVNDAKDLVNQAITYYNEVAKNQKITIDVNKFSTAASTFAVNAQGMTNIGAQYDTASNEFAKAAGFTIEKK